MTTLDKLMAALEQTSTDGGTKVTSVRQSRALADATKAAVRLGWATSVNDGMNRVLREDLQAFARERALDEHLKAHPELTPDLADITIGVAALTHDPLADDEDLIRRAAAEIVAVKSDADPDDVLVWALSMLTHTNRGGRRRAS